MSNLNKLQYIASPAYLDKRTKPIWLQIYERLGVAMNSGDLAEGTKLPGEDDLAKLFNVSRITLRRALARHRREGRLIARKGVGVFVRSLSARYIVHQNEAFHDTTTGAEIRQEALSLCRKPASAGALEALGLRAGTEVIKLRMRSVVGAAPVYLSVKEFPCEIFPHFEEAFRATGTVLGAFSSGGVDTYSRVETRLFGDVADDSEAKLLQLEPNAPIIRSRSINSDSQGKLIEFNRGCWPMHSVELVFS